MEQAVAVSNAAKSFGDFTAVAGISFSIAPAECFGLLGPNGAGKTTLMKMLYGRSTMNSASGASIRVFGLDPAVDGLAVRTLTGVVPQDDNLDSELNVEQNLAIYAKFYGIPGRQARARIDELLDFMELGEKKKARIREISGGMKRRLVIARALLHMPRLLILDEPTTGLDPQVRHLIWNKLRTLQKNGMTILLTTHYMEEASQICDRLIIMDKGRAVLEGVPSALIAEHIERYVLEAQSPEAANRISALVNEALIRRDDGHTPPAFYGGDLAAFTRILEQLAPTDAFLRQANLEDLFLKATGRTLNEHQ